MYTSIIYLKFKKRNLYIVIKDNNMKLYGTIYLLLGL